MGMVDRKVHAPRTAALVVILFHRQPDGPVIHDRDHLSEVLGEDAEEQYLVAIVQGCQIDILAEGIREPLILSVGASYLRLQRADYGRKQTRETERFALLGRECRSLIQQGSGENRHSPRLGLISTYVFRTALPRRH